MRTTRGFIGLALTTALSLALAVSVFWFVYSQPQPDDTQTGTSIIYSSGVSIAVSSQLIVSAPAGVISKRIYIARGNVQPQPATDGNFVFPWAWAGLALLVVGLLAVIGFFLFKRMRKPQSSLAL